MGTFNGWTPCCTRCPTRAEGRCWRCCGTTRPLGMSLLAAADRPARRLTASAGAAGGGPGGGTPGSAAASLQPAPGAVRGTRPLARSLPRPVGAAYGRPTYRGWHEESKHEGTHNDQEPGIVTASSEASAVSMTGRARSVRGHLRHRHPRPVVRADRPVTVGTLDRHVEGRPAPGRPLPRPLHQHLRRAGRIDVCDAPRQLLVTFDPGTLRRPSWKPTSTRSAIGPG